MNIASVNLIYFSPTGTSKKVVQAIGREIGGHHVKEFDLTPSVYPDLECKHFEDELTIIGVPVYKGRLPLDVLTRLKRIKTQNALVVVVAVYGNREFDDALLELKDLSLELGFTPIAAAAFIGEHSYSTDSKPLAKDRPDEADISKVKQFAKEIAAKIHKIDNAIIEELTVPGNHPYKISPNAPVIAPTTLVENCSLCGVCSDVCPVGVIEVGKMVMTDAEACIWCCACVKACPEDARIFDDPIILDVRTKLASNCKIRKEPEFFI